MSPNELSELGPIAKTLNQESNDLNKTIIALDLHLAALNLGIEVWCGPCDEDSPFQIGYAKVEDGKSSEWQLATRSCVPIFVKSEEGWEIWEAKPGSLGTPQSLLRASRNVRVDGLEVIPQIIRALKTRAESKIATIRKAKKLAADLSADLSVPPASRAITVAQPPVLSDDIQAKKRKATELISKLTK
jgi:hypothetical protein